MNKNISNLINLAKENPTLKIVPMVDSDVVADCGYNWWMGSFGSVEIDEMYSPDDRVWLRSNDEEELENIEIENITDDDYDGKELSEQELDDVEKQAKERVKNYKWEKVITISIGLP